jgi:hypothetical protein
MPRRLNECGELGVCDRVAPDRERREIDLVGRALAVVRVPIRPVGAHYEGAAAETHEIRAEPDSRRDA